MTRVEGAGHVLSTDAGRRLQDAAPGAAFAGGDALFWTAGADGSMLSVSDAARSLLERAPEEITSADDWDALVFPADRARYQEYRRAAPDGGSVEPCVYRITRRDGTTAWVRETVRATRGSTGERLLHGMVVDITPFKDAEARLRLKDIVTQALAEQPALEDAAARILPEACETLGWDLGVLWSIDGLRDAVTCVAAWPRELAEQASGPSVSTASAARGDGLVAWSGADRSPAWITDRPPDGLPGLPAIEAAGVRSEVAVPITARGEVLGVIELFSRRRREPDSLVLAAVTNIAAQVGQHMERARALAALVESEERFRNVANSAPVLLWMSGVRGEHLFFNDGWLAFTGRTLADELTAEWGADVHPDDRERATEARQNAVVNEQPLRQEYRHRRHDGQYRWLLESAAPRFSQDRQFLGHVGSCIDITDRRLAEESKARSEQMYRSLAEAIPAMVMITSANGHVEYGNGRFLEFTGRTLDQLQGLRWADLLHPEEIERGADGWIQLVTHEQSFSAEFRLRRHDGRYCWFLGHTAPLRGADGRIFAWLGASVDIDERKRAEARQHLLSEASSVLSSKLDYQRTLKKLAALTVPALADICAIDVCTSQGTVERIETRCADRAKKRLFSKMRLRDVLAASGAPRTADEAVALGRPMFLPHVDEGALRALAPHEDDRENARRIGARSAIVIPMRARGEPLGAITLVMAESGRCYDEADLALAEELGRRAAIAVDNARLFEDARETAEHLARANAAKDEFLGMVSHELSTPITTISGNAHVLLIRGGTLDTADQQAALVDIERESLRLQQIIDNMLVLARVEASPNVTTEPILLKRALTRVVADHRRRFPSRVVNLEAPEFLPISTEPTYFDQILRNLLSNAEKYSPRDRPIDVEATVEEDRVVVRVLDAGRGIDTEDVDQIFRAFYRSPRTSGQASGAGLGLAVCKRLLEAQGGSIWARPRPGGGAEFGFSLPVDEDAAE